MTWILWLLLVFVSPAHAQCNGLFPAGDVCGAGTTTAPPAPIPFTTTPFYTIPQTGGVARSVSSKFQEWFSVKDFGAVGDNTTDDTAALQAAATAAALGTGGTGTMFLPCGIYLISSSITINGINVIGQGGCSQISVKTNIGLLKITSNGQFVMLANFQLVADVNSHTAAFGISVTGTTVWTHNIINNIICSHVYECIHNNTTVGSDWNMYSNIQANDVNVVIHHVTNSGTGNVISGGNYVFNNNGIQYDGTGGAIVGDTQIENIEFGGLTATNCISLNGAATYKARITIANSQCDAGPTTFVSASGYNLNMVGNNWGGAVTNAITNCVACQGDFGPDGTKVANQLIFNFGTAAPGVTIASGACGATTNGTLGAGSVNQTGLVQIGSASTTTCTITFSATLVAAPLACVLFPANAAAAATGTTIAYVSAITTGHFVITGSALANANYYYHCI